MDSLRKHSYPVVLGVLVFCSFWALPSSADSPYAPCALGVAPNVLVLRQDRKLQIATTQLLTSNTYDKAKLTLGADILDLLGFNLGFSQDTKNRKVSESTFHLTDEQALAVYTSYLSDEARKGYFDCVKSLASAPGIWLAFKDETRSNAALWVKYVGIPGSTAKLTFSVRGAGPIGQFSLPHDAERIIDLTRHPGASIRVAANSVPFVKPAIAVSNCPPTVREVWLAKDPKTGIQFKQPYEFEKLAAQKLGTGPNGTNWEYRFQAQGRVISRDLITLHHQCANIKATQIDVAQGTDNEPDTVIIDIWSNDGVGCTFRGEVPIKKAVVKVTPCARR